MKISAAVAQAAKHRTRIIIKFRDCGCASRFCEGRPGATACSALPMAFVDATEDLLNELKDSEAAVDAWVDTPVKGALDHAVPAFRGTWVREVAKRRGAGVRIAILDTGVDPTHPDLSGRVVSQQNFTDSAELTDQHGHGTHVAGIAAGSGVVYRGMAPQALVVSAKVLGDDNTGFSSWVIAGVDWALTQQAAVVNLSLGSLPSSPAPTALDEACNAAVAAGAVVIAAAGNDGPSGGTINSPAVAAKVIAVGASTNSNILAAFSSRGPTLDGRTKPEVVAPGVGVVAPAVGGGYVTRSGTSMAAPLVSGLCACVLGARPSLTPAEFRQILIATTREISGGPNDRGYGSVDAARAFQLLEHAVTIKLSTGLKRAAGSITHLRQALRYGVLDLYDGVQPESADHAATGTLVARITTGGLPFAPGAAAAGLALIEGPGGALVRGGPWVLKGLASGTARWFRWRGNGFDSGGASALAVRLDGAVGRDLVLADTSITPTTELNVAEFTIRFAN